MKWVQVLAAALLALAATAVGAQGWPQKPVRFIVPFPPGGATDISARLLGEKLAQIWGQQVVIENRGGAGGGVGAAEAARAAPDGYTLFFPSGSVVTANQHIYAKMNYDPEKDFVPVTNVVSGPQVLAVPANSPYKTVKELIDAAKASPGKLTFGHAGIGTQTHLAAENFLNAAEDRRGRRALQGRGAGARRPGRGQITLHRRQRRRRDAATSTPAALRALGVTSKARGAAASGRAAGREDAARLREHGLVRHRRADRHAEGHHRQGVPRHQEGARRDATCKARFFVQGLAPVGNTPEEFGKAMKEETRALGEGRARAQDQGEVKSRSAQHDRGSGEGALHPGAEAACRPTSSRASTRSRGARPTPARSACSARWSATSRSPRPPTTCSARTPASRSTTCRSAAASRSTASALKEAIRRGCERATREHPLRSSVVHPDHAQ